MTPSRVLLVSADLQSLLKCIRIKQCFVDGGGVALDSGVTALIIIAVMLILYVTELLPIAVTSLLACLALAVFGVIPLESAFSGFGNDIVFMLAGMTVVGAALFETGAAGVIGRRIISVVCTNEKAFIAALMVFSIPFSAFLSNTATAAIMLPIASSAITASGGKLLKKHTYMAIGITCVAGGGLTLVSSTPQLIAQGLLKEGGYQTIGFFTIGAFGLPILALLMVFFLTFGFALQKKVFDFPEVGDGADGDSSGSVGGSSPGSVGVITDLNHDSDAADAQQDPVRMYIALGALVFCIIGYITGLWTMGIVSMTGAVVCVAAGCIPQKTVFLKIDWTTVILMGCSFGVAAGLDVSGGGKLIAQSIISLLGDNVSPWLLFSSLALTAVILTNLMSSTATGALLIPIAIYASAELGYDVKSAAIAVAIAANVGYATPISTPPLTMTLSGGYRFKDYLIVGGVFNILAYALLVVLFPLVLSIR